MPPINGMSPQRLENLSFTMSRRLLLSILRPSSIRPIRLSPSPDLSTAIMRRISIRTASTAVPPKTIVLEKPDKFRPPSHPQRLNRKPPRQYPGPPLSEQERQAQQTRRYPHMFPNEGTALHWFLTNKWIHMWISLVRCNASILSILSQYPCVPSLLLVLRSASGARRLLSD